MPTMQEMTTSLEDARFFNDKIEKTVGEHVVFGANQSAPTSTEG